ncbi:docking protein 2-like [Penaeus chinensis]|uniref:docking protein 2-like n=1 Tax=Penaeus chinensis TaxID=139456 RepID=UPI001FB6CB5B|nr:docking protein 2-like [Penaeus chinensis]XP_047480117.1 docking protein 2-like [Penaeus chinensis]XP_047480118.1 docking protein 2-like [Penaeus chinensis]
MAMNSRATEVMIESPCKTGLVNSRIKGGILKKHKQLYAKLYKTSRSGVARIELYSDGKASVSGPPSSVIVASEVTKVAPSGPLSFQVSIKDQVNDFSVDSKEERNAWVRMIQDVFFQPQQSANSTTKVGADGIVSENDIYISADEVVREFMVTIGAETRSKLAVDGQMRLLIEDGHITLISPEGKRVMRWSMGQLRRFGYRTNDFHLEAGRKSESGEGVFSFVTNQGRQIHAMVSKEKARTRTSGMSQTPSLPVGQVTPPEASDAPVITIGGHTYEEVEVMQNKPSPTKPPRPSQNKFSNDSPTESPSTTPVPITFANIKSPRTNSVSVCMDTRPGMLPAANTLPRMTHYSMSDKNIYSEPEIPTQAWRTHGTDVYDKITTDNTYDTLQHYQPVAEDHYANNHVQQPRPQADAAPAAPRKPQFPQHIVVNQEATYAVISKPRVKQNSGPGRTDKPDATIALKQNSLI